MPETATSEETVPKAWMKKEKTRATETSQPDVSLHQDQSEEQPLPKKPKTKSMKPANQQQEADFIDRGYKGMRPTKDRIAKFDSLIATQKNKPEKKKGPELIDEALDLLFKKYGV